MMQKNSSHSVCAKANIRDIRFVGGLLQEAGIIVGPILASRTRQPLPCSGRKHLSSSLLIKPWWLPN